MILESHVVLAPSKIDSKVAWDCGTYHLDHATMGDHGLPWATWTHRWQVTNNRSGNEAGFMLSMFMYLCHMLLQLHDGCHMAFLGPAVCSAKLAHPIAVDTSSCMNPR